MCVFSLAKPRAYGQTFFWLRTVAYRWHLGEKQNKKGTALLVEDGWTTQSVSINFASFVQTDCH